MKTISNSGRMSCRKAVFMSTCWIFQSEVAAMCKSKQKDSRHAVGAIVLS